ncbi:chromosome partitioning protein ParA [Vibrio sp. JC009]|uniref:chromosome partitioning protein ParA n=1 Tax=Vibrio sp. JC009 TaxID=2912314 RepID=UPI0023B13E9E|nr:chromosome partitioning protein ParA [Vibrio sp. JC009]WED22557.1 chromosome partitioning protein ParA [Vibrio sp. JC009]
MVTIQGLPATVVNKPQKAKKRAEVKKDQTKGDPGQTTRVADAVSSSIRQVKESEIEKAQIQYDLPEGNSRKALEEYMEVLNRARKEELAQLVGVDIYI